MIRRGPGLDGDQRHLGKTLTIPGSILRRSRRWSGSPFGLNQSEKAVPYSIIRPVLLILLVMLSACRPAAVEEEIADNEALRLLAEADQQDRQIDFSRLSEEEIQAISQRDAEHRAQVEMMLKAGEVRTPDDHMNAALILQHGGDSTAYRKAYELSRDALQIDSTFVPALRFMPVAYDRYLISIGQPQVYATQFYWNEQEGWVMPPVDTTEVTEEERLRLTGRTLAQRRAALQCLKDGGEFNACNGVE